jgi:2-polyprenyl-6-methoxyphenol hydroxylase-like FAD-dependent oxidoreductase
MVRQLARIPFRGRTYGEHAVLADVDIDTPVPVDEARVHIDRNGIVTLFPMNERLRRIVVISPHEPLTADISREWLQARIDRVGLSGTIAGDPRWSSVFGVHRRVAQRMRAGNVFLAGDAAHAHSPVGGQGMNVGFEDAWMLAEVLSGVLSGDAAQSSLDRYEALRLPAARAVVRHTDLLLRALAHPNRAIRVGRELLAPYIIRLPLIRDRVVRELLTA